MKKQKTLTKEQFKKLYDLDNKSSKLNNEITQCSSLIENRTKYIVTTINRIFDTKLCVFNYDWIYTFVIKAPQNITLDSYHSMSLFTTDKFGKSLDLSKYFPSRWLFEKFEDEIKLMKKEINIKAKNSQKHNDKLIKSAKDKLSKDEYEALRDFILNKV